MKNPNLTERHLFPNKMNVNLDMLGTTMLNRVASHVDSADIITKDDSRRAERALKLLKKLTKPAAFGHGVGHSTILGLSTATRHRGLALGRPGHKVIAEVDTVTRSRPASVGAACPVRVRVCSERGGRSEERRVGKEC